MNDSDPIHLLSAILHLLSEPPAFSQSYCPFLLSSISFLLQLLCWWYIRYCVCCCSVSLSIMAILSIGAHLNLWIPSFPISVVELFFWSLFIFVSLFCLFGYSSYFDCDIVRLLLLQEHLSAISASLTKCNTTADT